MHGGEARTRHCERVSRVAIEQVLVDTRLERDCSFAELLKVKVGKWWKTIDTTRGDKTSSKFMTVVDGRRSIDGGKVVAMLSRISESALR